MTLFTKRILKSHVGGLYAGAVISTAIVIPWKTAAAGGVGWMFGASLLVVLASGVLLAHRMHKLNPFEEESK